MGQRLDSCMSQRGSKEQASGRERTGMETIGTRYQITVSDFRKASYYGLFLRYRRPLLFLAVVIAGALLYALAAALGLGQANPLVFLLAAAYAVWGLILAIGVEKSIGAYLRAPDNLLGCTFEAQMDSRRIRIRIPERNVDVAMAYAKLACAFELHALFMLYITPKEVYLLPKRALKDGQIAALREALKKNLKERFSTRFGK